MSRSNWISCVVSAVAVGGATYAVGRHNLHLEIAFGFAFLCFGICSLIMVATVLSLNAIEKLLVELAEAMDEESD